MNEFSSRFRWDFDPNPFAQALDEKRRAGERLIDMTVTNPTVGTGGPYGIIYPEERIRQALTEGDLMHYHPDPKGLAVAREAIAGYYATLGVTLDPEDIFLTSSTSEAYGYLFKLLTNPGDEVLIPRPGYPLFEFVTGMEYVNPVQYKLRHSGQHWEPDWTSLDAESTERTRAVIAIHPNNPTGNYYSPEEQKRLLAFCRSAGCALIVDEVFYEYNTPSFERPQPFGALDDAGVLLFTVNGFSKMLALPQLKLGWITLHGPEPLRQEARTRLELIADTYLSVNAPVMLAAKKLLALRVEIAGQVASRCESNERYWHTHLSDRIPAYDREGGWSLVAELPDGLEAEAWCMRLLQEHNVIMHPGSFYDMKSNGAIVLSLMTPVNDFQAGVERILREV